MAKRTKRHPETGEEIPDENEDLKEYEASQREQAEQMDEKREEESKAAEDMADQQKEATNDAKKHAGQLSASRKAEGRPKEIFTVKGEMISTEPTDLGDYEGEYTNADDGETYGLKLVPDDPHGHTHQLKNVDHFWSGSAEEFKQKFEKQ